MCALPRFSCSCQITSTIRYMIHLSRYVQIKTRVVAFGSEMGRRRRVVGGVEGVVSGDAVVLLYFALFGMS